MKPLSVLYVSGGSLDRGGIASWMLNYAARFDRERVAVARERFVELALQLERDAELVHRAAARLVEAGRLRDAHALAQQPLGRGEVAAAPGVTARRRKRHRQRP